MSGPSDHIVQRRATPAAPSAEASGLRERGRIRRRVRYLQRLREVQLRDLGGFVLELHRAGRSRPEIVEEKAIAVADTDRELRALEQALGERRPLSIQAGHS